MQNDKIVSLSEYLKAEKREARDDWKARLGFEEEVRNEYVKYSNLVSLATSRKELEEVSKKVRSIIRILEGLEVDKQFFLGDIPEGYLTPSWSNIAKTWKPKYTIIRKDIKFKLKTFTEDKPQKENRLSLRQIALLYFYEGKQITRENGKEIANEYGYESGDKLYQHFTFYSSTANRKAIPDPYSKVKHENKIELFESIIELLTNEKRDKALYELKLLKNLLEKENL